LVQFAHAPHFNHLNSVYNAFDFSGLSTSYVAPPAFRTGLPAARVEALRSVR
jgi:hypothetical protein